MKRRKRKRSSKAASSPKTAKIAETLASPSEFSFDSKMIANFSGVSRDSEPVATFPDTPADSENVASSPHTSTDAASLAAPSVAPTGADRLRTLETWLTESREPSWLAANRRRSQRVLMTVPVRVSGKTGAAAFEEDAHTRAISAHGALIHLSTQVHRGQRLTLSNVQTKAALECVVAHIDRRQRDQPQVGVEFLLPNPMFWHVAFPPKDWTPRHPDAKSRAKSRESS